MLCTPPPETIETLVGLFDEYCLAHPHIPHFFTIPHFITRLWINQLSKDADVLFTVNVGPYFWPHSMHEPLSVLIVFSLVHVKNYRGPWVIQGSRSVLGVHNQLETGFKNPDIHGCRNFYDLEGTVHGVRDLKEDWIQAVLIKFIEAQETFPSVLCVLVRRMIPPPTRRSISSTNKPS